MNRLVYPRRTSARHFVVGITFAAYVAAFAIFHNRFGNVIGTLAILPVIGASWYYGVRGGILTALGAILANEFLRVLSNHSFIGYHLDASSLFGTFALVVTAFVVGRLGTISRERKEALKQLEESEEIRRGHTDFLQSLSDITRIALEARDLHTTLEVLVERITLLFGADSGYLALWDEASQTPIPTVAHGPLKDQFPKMKIEAGEHTLAASAMHAGHPLAVPDIGNSPYLNPRFASLFPHHSMLAMPLIVEGRKLAVVFLGYKDRPSFHEREIEQATITAQQIAVVLTKSQLLEESRRQVRQLTALHEVALASTQSETIDELIERTTEIVGKNLFPDNFGILLLDEEKGVLHAHPSYRFGAASGIFPAEVPLGQGITGQVARTGQPIRLGNVSTSPYYLHVDPTTTSELCVPIKIQDRVLGVINSESSRPEAFSLDDETLLGTLAGQLATAIERLRAAAAERQWLDQLAHSNELIYALAHITTHVEKALSPEDVTHTLGAELRKINLTCATALYDRDQKAFVFNYTSMEPQILEQFEAGLGLPLLGYRLSARRLNSVLGTEHISQAVVVSNPEQEIGIFLKRGHGPHEKVERILETLGIGSRELLLRLPLTFEENLVGFLWIWGQGITQADLPVMSIFAKQIGISLERARLFQEVQSLALIDPLTGLHNRRSLFELGRIELSRAHRMNRPFCCMMLDADHFKRINDTYGHGIGDQVLREFAQRCRSSVREVDLVGRYGGEEIVVLLPETDSETALQVAERLRATIEKTPVQVSGHEIKLTISIGVSRKDEHTLELETLIARADQALYIAKHKGRNQVAIST